MGLIWLKFELIRDVVAILVISKYEEDPIKIEGDRVATPQNIDFLNTQGQITPQLEVGFGRNSNSSEMIWMSLLLPIIKNIRIKIKPLDTQSRADNSAVKGLIWLKFELIRAVMAILVTSKYEEDPIKIEGARVATTLNNGFSNTQGQLTPQSEIGSS